MNLHEFVKVLLSVTDRVYQDEANQESGEYIVWSEQADRSLRADDSEAEYGMRLSVMIFTDKPMSELPRKLRKAFSENSIAYEDFQSMYYPELKFRQYSTFVEVT